MGYNLAEYVGAASYWECTPEGYDFWSKFKDVCLAIPVEEAASIRNILPEVKDYLYPGPFNSEYAPYAQLLIIAKYWHRFGRLPSVELLKELRA